MAWTLRLPADLEEALVERCRVTGAPKSAVVVLALRAYLRSEVKPELLRGDDVRDDPGAPGHVSPSSGGKVFRGPDPRSK